MAIISVLMGFGIGMFINLSSAGKADQAQSTILETIHAVKNSSRGYGAALVIDPEQNLVYGLEFRTVLSSNFEADLDDDGSGIVGIGYKAQLEGKTLHLALGYSHPVDYPIPEGIEIKVDKLVRLSVSGIDRQKVGQVAAEIRAFRPPEPYKGKGIRYAGETVKRKAGKAGKAAGA